MTKLEFMSIAIRKAELAIGVKRGWWGTYRDVHGPKGQRVRFSKDCWVISKDGRVISRHDSRSYAIAKAYRL